MKIAALFVEVGGPYWLMGSRIDFWDINRDARLYRGPWPVIAHPPCERWGKYWFGSPIGKTRKVLGDDDGCFESALNNVRRWGGAIEHPFASHAWKAFDLPKPSRSGGWIEGNHYEWSCCVDQGHYGHLIPKPTWLFAKSITKPIDLIWGPSVCSINDPRVKTKCGSLALLSRRNRRVTPESFAKLLIEIAANSRSLVTPSQ